LFVVSYCSTSPAWNPISSPLAKPVNVVDYP
jgi:hypothetical protein